MDEQFIKKILPHNMEAEQSVIGSMMMDPDAINVAMEFLTKEDFYGRQYGLLFDAMQQLHKEGRPVDMVTLPNKLEEMELPEELSAVEFLSGVLSSVPTSVNVKAYSEIVKEKSILRKLIQIAKGVEEECYLSNKPLNDILEDTEKQVFNIVQYRNTGELADISAVALEALGSIEKAAKNKGNVTGIATGYDHLDYMTAGLQPSDLIIIGARPSVGKTAFALNIATLVTTRSRVPTAIFSLEMSKEQLVKRIFSIYSKVDSQKIRTGNLMDEDWINLVDGVKVVGDLPLIIDDTPGISMSELRSKCRKLKLENDLGLVIIDYLQLMTVGGGRRTENRQQEISEISRSLKALAREIQAPVVALSQLHRGVEQQRDKRPSLSDIRESGAIEQDADVVMFLHREDYYDKDTEDKGVVEVIIAKQRNGPTGTVNLKWIPEYNLYGNIAYQD